MDDDRSGAPNDPRVHPVVARLAAYGWRLLVIAAVVAAGVWLLRQLWVLFVALAVATFITRALDGPARWLRSRGARPALAAAAALLMFLGGCVLIGWTIVPRVADEFSTLGPTITDALDDVEDWLVEDSPFDLDRRDVNDLRGRIKEAATDAVGSSGDSIISGALMAVEVLTALFLSLVTTFFLLKDGARFQQAVLRRVSVPRREPTRRMAARAWQTIGGYLRGAAMLGALEGVVAGVTLVVVGAELALPVAVLTFVAAFVPMVGAIAAGIVAVLVTLATAGFGPAVAVALIMLAVQQLDNDLLAPVIYGRTLELHPLVILFSVVGGGALFGLAGTFLAVPVVAVCLSVSDEAGWSAPPD